MKRFIIPLMILVAGFSVATANAQVYVHARIPIPLPPIPRFLPAPPQVEVYPQGYAQEQPYYESAPAPVIVEGQGGYYGRGYDRRYYDRFHGYRGANYGRGYYRHEERGRFFDHGRGRESHRRW